MKNSDRFTTWLGALQAVAITVASAFGLQGNVESASYAGLAAAILTAVQGWATNKPTK
jgi:hypothetical protein